MAEITFKDVACGEGSNESLLRVAFQFLYFPGSSRSEKELEMGSKVLDSEVMEALRRLEEGGFITSRLEKVEEKNAPRKTIRKYQVVKPLVFAISNG